RLVAATHTTLPDLFQQRVACTPDALAYRFYAPREKRWGELSWRAAAARVQAWRAVLNETGVVAGDRVAIMLRNSPEWLCVDQAVLSLGAVTVGLYCADTPGNNAAILQDSGARILVAVKQQWVAHILAANTCPELTAVFVFAGAADSVDQRVQAAAAALAAADEVPTTEASAATAASLASLVYASGTSARPRACMMSHRNLLWCSQALADALPAVAADHSVYYVPLANSYARVADAYRAMLTGAT